MAIRRSGLEFLVRNYRGFTSAIDRVNQSYRQIGKTAQGAARDITNFGAREAAARARLVESGRRVERANLTVESSYRRLQIATRGVDRTLQSFGSRFKSISRAYPPLQQATDRLSRAHDSLKRAVTSNQRSQENYERVVRKQGVTEDQVKQATDRWGRSQIRLASASKRVESAQKALTREIGRSGALTGKQENATRLLSNALDRESTSVDNVQKGVKSLTSAQQNQSQAQAEAIAAFAAYNSVISKGIQLTALLQAVLTPIGILLAGLALAVGSVVVSFRLLSGIFNTLIGIIKKLVGVVLGLASVIGNVLKRALDAIIFSPIRSVLNSISQSFANMAQEAAASVGEFQRLNLQFRALAARDIAQRFGGTISDAMVEASTQAQQLLQWVAKLAVTTPFDIISISRTLALGNAMGLTIGPAQQLTKAIINFASAMGLTGDHVERIIYNFGQMVSQGKLTGREFRDLAISFVPMERILREMAEEAGSTFEAFRELALEGGVQVEEFFAKFVEVVERDFAGAAEAMARTITGVINNLKDFLQFIVGFELIGPLFNRITSVAADALNNLLSPAVRDAAHLIGEVLARAFDVVKPFVDAFGRSVANLAKQFGLVLPTTNAIAKAIAFVAVLITRVLKIAIDRINEFGRTMGTNMETLRGNMARWGAGLIAALAQGMARAAQLVVKVITYIANIIASLLRTSSPPKILPDLPRWGMEAMEEWLRGFTLADFDALKGIQAPLRQALDLLARTGVIAETQVGTVFRDISMAIAEAISSGQVDEELFEFIRRSVPVWGDEIAELAEAHIRLAAAVNAVRVAEEALEAARQAEEAARTQISAQVREYNRLIRAGASRAVLNARLAEINATEEAARLATEQRLQAEQQLEQAEAQVEALREQVQLLENIVQQLLEITEAQIVEIDTSSASDAIEELGEELAGIFDFEPELPDLPADVTAMIDQIFRDVQTEVDAFILEVTTAFDTAFGPGSSFAQSFGSLKTSIDEIRRLWDEFVGRREGPRFDTEGFEENLSPLERIMEVVGNIAENIKNTDWGKFADAFKKVDWKEVGNSLLKILESLGKVDFEKVADSIVELIDAILLIKEAWPSVSKPGNLGLQALLGPLYFPLRFLADKIVPFAEKVGAWLREKVIQPVIDAFQWLLDKLIGDSIIPDIVNGIMGWWTQLKELGAQVWQEIVDAIWTPIVELWDELKAGWEDVRQSISDKWEKIKTALAEKAEAIRIQVAEKVEQIKTTLAEKWEAIKTFAITTWENLKTAIGTKITEVKTKIHTTLNLIKTKWDEIWGAIKEKIHEIFVRAGNVYEKIKEKIDLIKTAFETTLTDAINAFRNGPLEWLRSKFQTVIDTVSSLWTWIGNLATALRNFDFNALLRLLSAGPFERQDRQGGGQVRAGVPYVVGEKGWEWFVPAMDGWILNQQQAIGRLATSVSGIGATAMVGGGSVGASKVLNFYLGGVNVSNDIDAAKLLAMIRTEIRREFS